MDESFVIKSSRGSARLELADANPDSQPRSLDYLMVALKSEGLQASARVYNYDAEGIGGLAAFFTDIAANWRGWKDEKRWESIEGDFKLSCTSDDLGHVEITVKLSSMMTDPMMGWDVSCTLMVEAGQLESLAQEVKRFFAYE